MYTDEFDDDDPIFTFDEHIKFWKRQMKLMSMGMAHLHAMQLAHTLMLRDRPDSGDDRKLCIECKNWKGKCMKPKDGYCSVPTILQRCDGFVPIVLNKHI